MHCFSHKYPEFWSKYVFWKISFDWSELKHVLTDTQISFSHGSNICWSDRTWSSAEETKEFKHQPETSTAVKWPFNAAGTKIIKENSDTLLFYLSELIFVCLELCVLHSLTLIKLLHYQQTEPQGAALSPPVSCEAFMGCRKYQSYS